MIAIKSEQNEQNTALYQTVLTSYETLLSKRGVGNELLGWMDVPSIASLKTMRAIQKTANLIKQKSEYVVVVGIGGSYLGARAVIEALSPSFQRDKPEIIYAGHHLSESYMAELINLLNKVEYSIVVISKSGTTTETAIAFRILEQHCKKKYGKKNSKYRIVCITDEEKGALKTLATQKEYPTFVIPDNVGGRYSVLSPVGLLPIALANIDIKKIVRGANAMSKILKESTENNPAIHYAYTRNLLLNKGYNVEVMASFEPKFYYFVEWWKQLFGESEGKENKGIFPTGLIYTTDLHSMGQYMQQGQRLMFETFLSINQASQLCRIPKDELDLDGLNYIASRRISDINQQAKLGTILAHQDGGVPTIEIEIEKLNAVNMGALIYFFEFSCALSAYTLGVNPFNQPGVEDYKKNMFALLNKKGYEKENKILQKRILSKDV